MVVNEKLKEQDFENLLESILKNYGYDFRGYSKESFKRRTDRFMEMYKTGSMQDLEQLLINNEAVFEKFVQEITVNVTAMFRDPEFYKGLKEKVFPRLATYSEIKIWIAGCATGEEVYSLAILLKEADLYDKTQIYATDINQRSLKRAKEGVYSIMNMQEYTANYHNAGGTESFSDYYHAKFNSVMFDKGLRKNIWFGIHNLVSDKSFNEFNLIICRNVLIYFNLELQKKVIALFYDSLCHFGFLGLGNKESLLFSGKQEKFETINRAEKIYMLKGYFL